MAKQKKRKPQTRAVPAGELVGLAEERLRGGRPEEAIRLLREAEEQIRHSAHPLPVGTRPGEGRPGGGAKGPALPPHLAALQPRIAPLLARAHFERALALPDPAQKIGELETAAKLAPAEARYRLALGACRLAAGQPEPAFESLRQARELAVAIAPSTLNSRLSTLADRAFALALLATGHTREVKEWLKSRPAAGALEQRLAAIRDLMVGHPEAPGVSHRASTETAPPASPGASPAARLIDDLAVLAAGDEERARERLGALPALDGNPTSGEAAALATQLFYSGALQFQAGCWKGAAGDLREALRLARGHALVLPWLDRVTPYLHQLAASAVRENDLNRAAELWSQILEQDPEDRVAAANLKAVRGTRAAAAWYAGALQEAVDLWREALRSNPHDEQLLRSLAIGTEKLGQKAEAIDHWRALAHLWRQQAKRRASEAGFTERLMRLEQHLVQLMLEDGRPPAQLLHELESSLKIDPSNSALRRTYAELLTELGRPGPALKQLEMLELSQGESADLLAQKAMTLDLLDRRAAALQALRRALELEPAHPVARQGYLLLLGDEAVEADRRGETGRAREICQEQLSLDPQYAPALGHLAAHYFAAGEDQEARNMIARLTAAEPDNPRRYIMAGNIYLAFNKVRLADAELKRAVEIEPSAHCFYFVGRAYLNADKLKKALKHYQRAAASGGFDIVLTIARDLNHAGYFEEAQPFLDQATAIDPQHPEPHLVRATMWLDMGRIPEAQSVLKEAERLAARRSEFAEILEEIRDVREEIREIQELGDMAFTPSELRGQPPELRRLLGKYAGR